MPGEICNAASLIAMKSPGVLQPVDALRIRGQAHARSQDDSGASIHQGRVREEVKDTFRMAVADAAAVDLTLVTVGNVTETTGMTEENLNTHCANHGLAKATMVTAPTVQRAQAFGAETSSSTSVRAFWWSYMAMAAGLLVSSF